MPDIPDDATLRQILHDSRVIALVGASANPDRPSHGVALDLLRHGKRVIPVNPGLAGQALWGETVRASLSDIAPSERVDMIDIFRRSDQVDAVVEEALAHLPDLATVWMQIGVVNPAAAARAKARGIAVVMDRCPKVEFYRLGISAPAPAAPPAGGAR